MRVLYRTVLAGLLLFLPLAAVARTRVEQRGDSWILENDRLRVEVMSGPGRLEVTDKQSGYTWRQPEQRPETQPRFRAVQKREEGIAFETDFGWRKEQRAVLSVSLTLPDRRADLVMQGDMPDHAAKMDGFPFLDPFLLDAPQGVLAVADYCNGHIYPLDRQPFPQTWFGGDRLDMPWVGVCDLERGQGYALILETSDDSAVQCETYAVGERKVVAPRVIWLPSKGTFAYPRRVLYRFVSEGSYVALAKAYRAYAKDHGLLVTLAEKVKQNPNIRRLFGAPDVWGDATLSFAQQARAAGVEKMLIHGRSAPEEMRAINAMGYLTSEYDNYTDILPLEAGKPPDSSHDTLPDNAVLNADGKRMTAWLTFDKKTQYMKRCPARWVPVARIVIPKVLAEFPFLGRFIDVTTAEGLYECFDPQHPLAKADKRRMGEQLLGYVRSQNLVVGGEHGIWWGVPHQDYIEGMMSSYQFSWPAGHLIHPKTKADSFTDPSGYRLPKWEEYEQRGIGHEWRVPLWELVFHDCVLSTWYWGDSSDWLLEAAPEITPRKDAFNILYGTMPLLWANREGSWHTARDVFLRTYRNTCRLHEAIAGTEMVSHEFMTPDHAVQRTVFSDGTQCVVNFGDNPVTMYLFGQTYTLPKNGFAVKGPKIAQSLSLINGRPVTFIRQKGYLFTDVGGVEVTAREAGRDRLRIDVGKGAKALTLRPQDAIPAWDVRSTRAFALEEHGLRARHVPLRRRGDRLLLSGLEEGASLELVCRAAARLPDLYIASLRVTPSSLRQGEKATVRVTVQNGGGAVIEGPEVQVYADAVRADRRLAAARILPLGPDRAQTLSLPIDTGRIDGVRQIVVYATPTRGATELCGSNNSAVKTIRVVPDLTRWPRRRVLRVEAREVDREDEPVIVPMRIGDMEVSSVRVVELDAAGKPARWLPAQLDSRGKGEGELCFLLLGKTPANTSRRVALLWAEKRAGRRGAFLSPPGSIWEADRLRILAKTYRLRFENGTPVEVGPPRGKPLISLMIYSSAETGWTEEPGRVERFEVQTDGPARTVLFVRKVLRAGVVYEKTYAFYPNRFDLTITVNRTYGVNHRAYYARQAQFEDSQGVRATIDGQGDAEGVSGRTQNPLWYAVYTPDFAHSCLALTPATTLTYWDAGGYWGGIGLHSAAVRDIRLSYVFHPGAADAGFAEQDYRRLSAPMRVVSE